MLRAGAFYSQPFDSAIVLTLTSSARTTLYSGPSPIFQFHLLRI